MAHIFYIRDDKRNPVATVAWDIREFAPEAGNHSKGVEVGLSIRHSHEERPTFEKKLSRKIAEGRLDKSCTVVVPFTGQSKFQILQEILQFISTNEELPRRIRRHAKNMLKPL